MGEREREREGITPFASTRNTVRRLPIMWLFLFVRGAMRRCNGLLLMTAHAAHV